MREKIAYTVYALRVSSYNQDELVRYVSGKGGKMILQGVFDSSILCQSSEILHNLVLLNKREIIKTKSFIISLLVFDLEQTL